MNTRILFVDDEQQILDGIRRNLRRQFDVTTALGGDIALATLREAKEDYAVIVTDMRMPGMDGIQFLTQARQLSPDSVRIMLTGNADQETAVKAVNTGEVFKFLNKPCEQDQLETVLNMALRQYQLITAEKELLQNTLKGSIEALAEVLALVSPLAFGRVKRLRNHCTRIAKHMDLDNIWELDTAALLSQLGCVTLPEFILQKVMDGESMTAKEEEQYLQQASRASKLIDKIPRMENVSKIVAYQHKHFDGSGFPKDELKGDTLLPGSRILHVALAFDDKVGAGWSDFAAYEELKASRGHYDPAVLVALEQSINKEEKQKVIKVPLDALKEGMELCEDLLTDSGMLLACKGIEVNEMLRLHLANFKVKGVLSPRLILVRIQDEEEEPELEDNEQSAAAGN